MPEVRPDLTRHIGESQLLAAQNTGILVQSGGPFLCWSVAIIVAKGFDLPIESPEEHGTNRKGQALFNMFVADRGWAATKIAEDYGRDFDVEVFRDHKTTGVAFSVQLKSSLAPGYSAGGEFISQKLKRRHALLF